MPKRVMKEPKEIEEIENITHKGEGKKMEAEKKTTPPKAVENEDIRISPPFSETLAKNMEDDEMRKFLKVLKKVEFDIPLVTVLKSKQRRAEFLKELCERKVQYPDNMRRKCLCIDQERSFDQV